MTAGGRRHPLPDPFFVLATQNPIGAGGHLSAARGAPRPVPVQDLHHLSDARRGAADLPAHHRARGARDHADVERRPNRGPPAPGAEGARIGPLHRVRHGPGPRDPRAGARRAVLHRRIRHVGRRAARGTVADPGGQGAGRAGRPAERLGRRHPLQHPSPVLRHRIVINYNAQAAGESSDSIVKKLLSDVPIRKGADDAAVAQIFRS